MKKILCIFICILLFGGCGSERTKEPKKEPLDFGGFECVVRSKVNNIEISAKTVYTPFKSLVFTFAEPKAVCGTKISCKSGEYTLKTDGFECTLTGDKMPFTMICKALEDCLNNVRGASAETDGVYTYQSGGRTFKLYTDCETNCFRKLTMDGTDLLTFENFAFLPQ